MTVPHPDYAELGAVTNFTFLHGASHGEELVAEAKALGLYALGIADHNSLAGVVRAHVAAKEHGLRLLVGARLTPTDGPSFLCFPKTKDAYGQLSRLLSYGKMRAPKGKCHFALNDILQHSENQILILLPPAKETPPLLSFLKSCPAQLYLAISPSYQGENRAHLRRLQIMGERLNLPLVAHNDALYHTLNRKPLQDVLQCLRAGTTITKAGQALTPNAERHLKGPSAMTRLLQGYEDSLARSKEIADACTFSLDELRYSYPDEPVPPDLSPDQHLSGLTWKGADWRYPDSIPNHVAKALKKELTLIEELEVAPYFLTVHDIVSWARAQNILCQGRGSAANSAVCFCLGITSVDPKNTNLLFERFLSRERKEPPDIDVDFEHERREEVIQYIYERYGRDRAALTATVISYRPRSAIRDVCKALGLSEDIAAALASTVWGSWGKDIQDDRIRAIGLNPDTPMLRLALDLAQQLLGFPRHLSQHVGGFVLTKGPLVEMVPVGNAAMADRSFIEWDKDDIEALGMMKVDVLALGMLTCIRKSFDMLRTDKSISHTLASIPADDAATYDMLCRGDSLGVFQVESRAQMNMLPRLRPHCFYDLVIEVAIVRPGPIQGDMVHPYLRRRKGLEKVEYPSPSPEHGPADELASILKRTLGVPLFQEQAMQISIDAAKFSPSEANGLRRAMATFRKVGTIQNYQEKMVTRMIERGYDPLFAERCFEQVKGFGEYGFPESHAASFALLVYVSSWLKCHHPDIFCAALLNSQPMGFYAPAQIVRDAKEHGVTILPPDINRSAWDTILEPQTNDSFAVRLGLRQIDGLIREEIEQLIAARGDGYTTVHALRQRTNLSHRTLKRLAAADAFGSTNLRRRDALWASAGEVPQKTLPLFAESETSEMGEEDPTPLPAMPRSEEVIQDYQSTRLSLKDHPLSFLRRGYRRMGLLSTQEAISQPHGRFVKTAGIVLVRQKPGTAKGVVFVTIEDETGVANLVIWKNIVEQFRPIVMGARIIGVEGEVQTADHVTHIIVHRLADRTRDFAHLSEEMQNDPLRKTLANADEVARPVPERRPAGNHPRNLRVIPKSRDFH